MGQSVFCREHAQQKPGAGNTCNTKARPPINTQASKHPLCIYIAPLINLALRGNIKLGSELHCTTDTPHSRGQRGEGREAYSRGCQNETNTNSWRFSTSPLESSHLRTYGFMLFIGRCINASGSRDTSSKSQRRTKDWAMNTTAKHNLWVRSNIQDGWTNPGTTIEHEIWSLSMDASRPSHKKRPSITQGPYAFSYPRINRV